MAPAAAALVATATIALLVFYALRRMTRAKEQPPTATRTDQRMTQNDRPAARQLSNVSSVVDGDLRAALKRVARLEELVEDLITIIGPNAATLLWRLRDARAKEEAGDSFAGMPESLAAQIERLSAQFWAYETVDGENVVLGPSASTILVNGVAPAVGQKRGASVGPRAGEELRESEEATAPDWHSATGANSKPGPPHSDPAAGTAASAPDLEVGVEPPSPSGPDNRGSAPADGTRWLQFSLAPSNPMPHLQPLAEDSPEDAPIFRSIGGAEEAPATDVPVTVQFCRADDTPLVVDLSGAEQTHSRVDRGERPPSAT